MTKLDAMTGPSVTLNYWCLVLDYTLTEMNSWSISDHCLMKWLRWLVLISSKERSWWRRMTHWMYGMDTWLFQVQIILFCPFLILHASTEKWPVWKTNVMNNRSKLYTVQCQRYRWKESGWSRAWTAMFRTIQGGWKCNKTTGLTHISMWFCPLLNFMILQFTKTFL